MVSLRIGAMGGSNGGGEIVSSGYKYNSTQTPGPSRPSTEDEKLVIHIAKKLNRLDVNWGTIASGLTFQSIDIQRQLANIIVGVLDIWAMRAPEYPGHPLEPIHLMARRMMDTLNVE